MADRTICKAPGPPCLVCGEPTCTAEFGACDCDASARSCETNHGWVCSSQCWQTSANRMEADSFTNQKPRATTDEDLKTRWSGGKPGEFHRCYLCGHKFKLGEVWRWIFANFAGGPGGGNFVVCEDCDGPDVMDKWAAAQKELKTRFWWALERAFR